MSQTITHRCLAILLALALQGLAGTATAAPASPEPPSPSPSATAASPSRDVVPRSLLAVLGALVAAGTITSLGAASASLRPRHDDHLDHFIDPAG